DERRVPADRARNETDFRSARRRVRGSGWTRRRVRRRRSRHQSGAQRNEWSIVPHRPGPPVVAQPLHRPGPAAAARDSLRVSDTRTLSPARPCVAAADARHAVQACRVLLDPRRQPRHQPAGGTGRRETVQEVSDLPEGAPLMRVAVTGATGFIGRHLVTRLAARGDEVVAISLRPVRDMEVAIATLESGPLTK